MTKRTSPVRKQLPFSLLVPGLVLLATTAGMTILSGRFVFGEGHADRPILEFLLLILAAFAAYFFAIERVRKAVQKPLSGRRHFIWILFVALACRLFLFPSELIQETDPYRYIWDGQAVLAGDNPYALSPAEAFAAGAGQGTDEEEVRRTFERINYPHVKTVYPPLAQGLFALSQWISPWGLGGWRALLLGADLLVILCLALILRRAGMNVHWVLVYAWSPLVLKEYSNSLHLDVFAVLFLCAAVYCLLDNRGVLAFLALALATLVKVFAIFLVPVAVAWLWRTRRRAAIIGAIGFLLIVLCGYLSFLGAGVSPFEGLALFAREWRVNEGLFGLIRWGTLSVFGSSPQLAGWLARIIAGTLFTAFSIGAAFWVARDRAPVRLGQACAVVLAALFFLAPVANPWYFTWVIPFLIFLPMRSLLLFSGLVFLYYLDFYFMYRFEPERFVWVRGIEYGLFFLCLGWELWTNRRRFLLSCRSPMNVPSSGRRSGI